MHVSHMYIQVIVIKKSASAKLGVSIKGGTKSSMGNPLDSNDKGIFISKVLDNRIYL